MINKTIKKSLCSLILTIIFCSSLNAAQVNFKLEHASLSRIDCLTDKYYKKFSHVKNIKKLTYTIIGLAGVAAGVYWYKTTTKSSSQPDVGHQGVKIDDNAKDDLARARLCELVHKHDLKEIFFDQLKNGLAFGTAGVIMKIFWDITESASNGCKEFWAWGNINNVQAYQEKQSKLKNLLLKMAMAPELNQSQELTDSNKSLIEIYMADFILTQRTMVYYLEDMLAYLKFLVLLGYGAESNEFVATDKNCAILCTEFNGISDKISLIINHDEKADKQAILSNYANFCRKFTKFACDCGVSLYGQDFLQK